MTLKQRLVRANISNPDGSAAPYAAVQATLTTYEVDGMLIVPTVVRGQTDATGTCLLELWPNDRGVNGSQYNITATKSGALLLNVLATVPDGNSATEILLESIITPDPPPTVDAATQAVIAAQALVDEATTQADTATAKAVLTAADRVQTGLDRVQTGLDRTQTGLDRTAASDSAAAALASQTDIHDNWQAKLDAADADAAAAAGSAATATTQAGLSDIARIAAQAAQTGAEAARDAVNSTGKVFTYAEGTAAGLAATTNGQQFAVLSADSMSWTIYRRVDASTALAVGPGNYTKSYIDGFKATTTHPGLAFSVDDPNGNSAVAVTDDGTFLAHTSQTTNATITTATLGTATMTTANATNLTVSATLTSAEFDTGAGKLMSQPGHIGFVQTQDDGSNNAAWGTKEDGTLAAKAVEVGTLNGFRATATLQAGGRFRNQLNYINNYGQSLAAQSVPATALTTTQEYDNLGLVAHSTSPTYTLPLTVANTQWSSGGESPMYGTAGHLKELLAEENGLTYGINDYQLLCCNNGYGGYTMAQLCKGTAPYTAVMSQVTSGLAMAAALGKSFAHAATIWTQGEAETSTSQAAVLAALLQLASDFNVDSRAITGQYSDSVFVMRQTTSTNRHVALAELEASETSSLIKLVCPMYQFSFTDIYHIPATDSKWLGGYYGLALKRLLVDGVDWQPLKPVGHAVLGNVIDLIFNKTGLVFDTTLVPAQVNQGFTVLNGSGSPITISSIAIVKPNRVRITCASAPASGWTISYGLAAAVGKGAYVGGAGNLRDRQGDSIVYSAVSKPLHNWCVLFDYSI